MSSLSRPLFLLLKPALCNMREGSNSLSTALLVAASAPRWESLRHYARKQAQKVGPAVRVSANEIGTCTLMNKASP